MNKSSLFFDRESRRRHAALRLAATAVVFVVFAACVMRHQFAAVGQVELTANLGAFSSAFVKAKTSVTATLTAGAPYNYVNPPVPPADESSLVPSYTWSVGPVQVASASGGPYRNAVLGTDYTLGPLPATADTVSILKFTPLVTGYWRVSVSCSVVVTDTKTNQKWDGGPAASGPGTFTSYILEIQYGGNDVDGQTENVCVGEQIPLTADVEPSDLGYQWNIMGTTATSYAPSDSASNLKPVTAAEMKSSPLTFYWVLPPQSSTDDVMLQLDGGPAVFSTFDVYQPSQKMTATYVGRTYVNSDYKPPAIWLYFGTAQGGDGVVFETSVTAYPQPFGGKVDYVQTIGADSVTVSQYDGILLGDQTYKSAMPAGSPPVLDSTFTYTKTGPYTNIPGTLYTDDGPGTPCSVSPVGLGFGSPYYESYLIIPTMYLIYQPALANAIWVPLDSYQWGWFGAAQESEITGDWSVQNGENNPSPPTEVTPTGEPTWNTNITEYDNLWVLQ